MTNPIRIGDIADTLVSSMMYKETDQDIIKLRSAAIDLARLQNQVETLEMALIEAKKLINQAMQGVASGKYRKVSGP